MADTKITSLLTPQVTTNPATDVLPIVNIADTSMASSGSTRKITVNTLLGAGGTATLASATITGNLTVDTNTFFADSATDRVGIGTATPGGALEVFKNTNGQNRLILSNPNTGTGAYDTIDFTAGTASNQILSMGSGYSGSFPYLTGALLLRSAQANGIVLNTSGSAAAIQFGINDTLGMTLNSTGLGVGVASPRSKLDVNGGLLVNNYVTSTNYAPLSVTTASAITTPSTFTNAISIYNPTTVGAYSNITFGYNALGITNAGAYIGYVSTSSAGFGKGDLVFGTRDVTTDTAATERLRIDSSGNVGIGVTPSAWGSPFKALQVSRAGLRGSTATTGLSFNTYFDGTNFKYIAGGLNALDYYQNSGKHVWQIAPVGAAANDPITGANAFVEAMTLDASGNLLVGKTAASATTIGFQTLANGEASVAMAASTSASSTLNVWSTGAAAFRFYVAMNGTISATNTTISAISDARLKENVQDIDVGLGAILALKPRKFDWKEGKGKNIKGDRGFIAQEFEQVFPQLVDEWKDPAPEGEAPYKSVRQDLIPVLVKAIQELAARVQTLETR